MRLDKLLLGVIFLGFGFRLNAQTFTIAPSNGPAAGGNTVVITNVAPAIGDGFDITNVTFGGTSVNTILGQGTDWVSVVAPAHAAGVVDILTYSVSVGVQTQSSAYTYNSAGSINNNSTLGWTQVRSLPKVTRGNGAASLNGKMYVFGGISSGSVTLTNVWSYNGSTWADVPGLPSARSYFGYTVVSGALYVVGGYNSGFSATTNAFKFNGTNWSEVAGLPVAKTEYSCGTLNGALYTLGQGTNVYLLNDATATPVNGLPISRAREMAGEVGGRMYAIGGDNGSGAGQTNTYSYDGTNWSSAAGLPAGRRSAGFTTLNNKIYIMGGINPSGTAATNLYIFDGTNWTESVGFTNARYDGASAVYDSSLYYMAGQSPVSSNVYRYSEASTGVSPTNSAVIGGVFVTITGSNLGDGSDITNVTLCGFPVSSISSQNPTQVVVVAAVGVPGTGHVTVYSTSYGATTKSNYFTYTGPNMLVLGTNLAAVTKGEAADTTKGTDFGSLTWGLTTTNTLKITNSGNSTLTILSFTTNGPNADLFVVTGMPATVSGGRSSNVLVQFSPPYAGSFTASVSVVNDSTSTPYVVNLIGTGAKKNQTITFPSISSQLTTNWVGLSATGTSALAVSFAVGSGSASITGGTNLSFTGAGSVSIIASQSGDTNWNVAADVTNTFRSYP